MDHLWMVLWQGVMLELLELVAGWHISELLASVVVQDGSRGLLMMTRSVPYYHCIRGWHGHRAHADRMSRVDTDRMILRHVWHHYVLHDLAKLARQVRIQLTHLNRHATGFAHVADHHLLVATLMIQLRCGLLYQHLTLAHACRSFLS